ncbi:MAG TPA: carboxypeptidase-like regulatory domain-containing protein [Bacteroidales bacterium]|jgi:hypothetical protein|nr:carboxypeptidase-like regulatory domain-containing protein [Bacteroidales bacterium]HPS70967.1 carboxypeptidase-like regulatory domain-containing protein [Bacteroidales bacterium]
MKKYSFLIFLLIVSNFYLFAQRVKIQGNVFDGLTFYPIDGANVYNFSTKKYTFTDVKGNFVIDVKLNDTIIISKSIFRQILIVINNQNLQNQKIEIALYFKAIILKEVIVYSITPDYKQFVKQVVTTPLPEIYRYVEGSKLTEMDLMNIKYAQGPPNVLSGTPAGSPITYLYEKYNKKYKNVQLAKELNELQDEVDKVPGKYNRELVSNITGLKDEELLKFMMYCRFSYYDIIKMSSEQIIMEVRKKYSEYEYLKIIEEEKRK